jgi:hypothetical protein
MKLNEFAKVCHEANKKWWQDIETGNPINRNQFELLALAISEVSECLEGERKNLMDDKLPHRKMAEVEMADTKIRLCDFSAGFGIPISEQQLQDPIPDNKGEALFRLMEYIVKIGYWKTPTWINLSLAYIEAYCVKFGYDLEGAVQEKMAYNATRQDHTHEARKIDGGKQF